ncbi:MAG TPA: cyclic lactone autoinducer peptide [Candidatus Lachnoclostridium pullistercoris]|uniref:Cyclic lactone autoinducer peptide n=1 Tax=Candidatus Lachnoclostridium pullistercoris TaxID=2838632 RepID=A0A9D2PHG3_9FIRM|nr:cyclic lactone autoinducer peptide [Candidatus Lachnoclostridium pullistercoris]
MKKITKSVLQSTVKKTASILSVIAMFFAISPCIGKIYEPKIPDCLKERIK